MGTRYKSVSDMVKSLTDEEFSKEFECTIAKKSLAKTLFVMRAKEGVTQKEMAARIGCSQARISKLENSNNSDIKVGDIVDYAQVFGLNMVLQFDKNVTAVDAVKFHATELKKHLDYLAELAHRDDDILESVINFYEEAFNNVLRLFENSAKNLPEPKKREPLEIHIPEEITEGVVTPVTPG